MGPAVSRVGLKGFDFASLSTTLLTDVGQSETTVEDLIEEGSSMSLLCLHGLVNVLSYDSRNDIDVRGTDNLNRSRKKALVDGPRPLYAQSRTRTYVWRNIWR